MNIGGAFGDRSQGLEAFFGNKFRMITLFFERRETADVLLKLKAKLFCQGAVQALFDGEIGIAVNRDGERSDKGIGKDENNFLRSIFGDGSPCLFKYLHPLFFGNGFCITVHFGDVPVSVAMFQTRRLQLKRVRIYEKTFLHETVVSETRRRYFQMFATEGQARDGRFPDKSIAARRSLSLL